jgi:murein DD-endopeptidase MepM/ murein hydrolase activator NlpD
LPDSLRPMSSPEKYERNLTLIVIPHDELETRSFIISYAKVRLFLFAVAALLVAFAVTLAILFPVMAQAARASRLEKELEELEGQRAKVAELARTLQQVEAQYEKVRQLLGADAKPGVTPVLPPLRGDSALKPPKESPEQISGIIDLWPLSVKGYITRALGGSEKGHPGVDVAVPKNSYIRAAGPGKVSVAGADDVYGQFIVLNHGHGLETLYGHASRLFVRAGDAVARGEVIALSGSTGRSTAPHLHFEVRRDGRPVDPLAYVRQP